MSNLSPPRARTVGTAVGGKRHFPIVASQFNSTYVQGLIDHATAKLRTLIPGTTTSLLQVPSAFEIPLDVREIALQKRDDAPDRMGEFWAFCPVKANVREFAQPIIEGMIAYLPEIDERIKRYCENYNLNRISTVDRNVLRLAIYEMLYRDDIPPIVSINEAIELAKTFGGAESGGFVNGILDRVRKDLTRPAREAVSSSQKERQN